MESPALKEAFNAGAFRKAENCQRRMIEVEV